MFKQLKSAIAECHPVRNDEVFRAYYNCSEEYLVTRSQEAILAIASGQDVERNTILVTRLLNLLRVKRNIRLQAEKAANEKAKDPTAGTS